MIPVTQTWIDHFENSSVCKIQIQVELANTVTFRLYSENIEMSSLSIDDCIIEPGTMKPGQIDAKCLRFNIVNADGLFDDIEFEGAKMIVSFNPPSGSGITKGLYIVTEALFKGGYVEITAYDELASKHFNEEPIDGYEIHSISTASYVIAQMFDHNVDMSEFPNSDYQLPSMVVGEEGSPLSKGTTRRTLAQYICEICGAYLTTHHAPVMGTDGTLHCRIDGKSLPVYDFTQELDGGLFMSGGDNADGGFFLAPFGGNNVQIINAIWDEEEVDGQGNILYQWYFDGNGTRIVFDGFDTTGQVFEEKISEDVNLASQEYTLGSTKVSDQFDIVLKNESGEEWIVQEDSTKIFASGTCAFYVRTKPNFNQSSITFSPILTDKYYLGNSSCQYVWLHSPQYDGGLFRFFSVTSPEVYPLTKIMTEPYASKRKIITKVVVSGSNIDTVTVGTDEGETIEVKDNPLIVTQQNAIDVANNLLSVLYGVSYHDHNVSLSADPRFETGDLISFADRRGNTVTTICTTFNYCHGNFSTIGD